MAVWSDQATLAVVRLASSVHESEGRSHGSAPRVDCERRADVGEAGGRALRAVVLHRRAAARDADFKFVAYEKKPYPRLPKRVFRENLLLDGQRLRWHEGGANVGKARGRVRRICVRLPDGHQLNLLGSSGASAPTLIAIMAARWSQENGFKHGVQRWGLNQLDGRTFTAFDADFVIPSPARRRLDASLAVLREAEGQLHRKLLRATRAELRAELERDRASNLKKQRSLEGRRPALPSHCTVQEADLHGELMRHEGEYKAVIDTIRTACINAEADLAAELAPAMARPREAKRLLRNFFTAAGDVRVTAKRIDVVLDVAATAAESRALDALCRTVNAWKLTHPGDAATRPLRFGTKT